MAIFRHSHVKTIGPQKVFLGTYDFDFLGTYDFDFSGIYDFHMGMSQIFWR